MASHVAIAPVLTRALSDRSISLPFLPIKDHSGQRRTASEPSPSPASQLDRLSPEGALTHVNASPLTLPRAPLLRLGLLSYDLDANPLAHRKQLEPLLGPSSSSPTFRPSARSPLAWRLNSQPPSPTLPRLPLARSLGAHRATANPLVEPRQGLVTPQRHSASDSAGSWAALLSYDTPFHVRQRRARERALRELKEHNARPGRVDPAALAALRKSAEAHADSIAANASLGRAQAEAQRRQRLQWDEQKQQRELEQQQKREAAQAAADALAREQGEEMARQKAAAARMKQPRAPRPKRGAASGFSDEELEKLTPEQRAMYEKMSPEEQAAYAGMSDEQRKAFESMSDEEKAALLATMAGMSKAEMAAFANMTDAERAAYQAMSPDERKKMMRQMGVVGETLGAAAIAALPAEQKALYQSMSEAEKAVFAAMSAEERAAFAAMSPEERAKLMRQQGVVGPPLSAAALAALPADQKRLYENMSDAERAAFASMSEEERMRYASMTAEQRAAYMRDTMGVEDLPGLVKLTPEQRALYQNMSPAERAAYEAMTAEQRAAYDKMSPADRAAYASMSEAQRKAFVANRKGGGKGGATGGQSGGGRGGKAWSAQKEEEDAAAKAAALLDNLDFSKIRAALPAGDDEESAYKRKAMFAQWDLNGNGALGCNEVATALRKLMDGVITDFMQSKNYGWANSWQHVLRKAFSHAKAANSEWLPAAKKRHDDFVEMDEFQLLLGYLLRYFELYVAFARMDTNRDQRVDRVEFQAALPRLAQWGISLSEDEAEDEWLALTGGRAKHVLFNQFINWALERNLMYF
jgi:hypothetical protein